MEIYFEHPVPIEKLEIMYSLLKDKFDERAFLETIQNIYRVCSLFPAVADFNRLKPRMIL
jgi:hypothetical protein